MPGLARFLVAYLTLRVLVKLVSMHSNGSARVTASDLHDSLTAHVPVLSTHDLPPILPRAAELELGELQDKWVG